LRAARRAACAPSSPKKLLLVCNRAVKLLIHLQPEKVGL
jgi:hypothetical protein